MKTYIFRLARYDGKQHLGELLNITIKARCYADAQMTVSDKYKEYYIVGHMETA